MRQRDGENKRHKNSLSAIGRWLVVSHRLAVRGNHPTSRLHCLPVVWTVDHRTGDVVIHEDQQRQTEAEAHRPQYCRPPETGQRRLLENLAFDYFESIHCRTTQCNASSIQSPD